MAKLSVDNDASCIITHANQPSLLHGPSQAASPSITVPTPVIQSRFAENNAEKRELKNVVADTHVTVEQSLAGLHHQSSSSSGFSQSTVKPSSQ